MEQSRSKSKSYKWLAIWRILTSDNFILFTFNSKFTTQLTGNVKDNIEVHPLVDDVITAIKKADYYEGE